MRFPTTRTCFAINAGFATFVLLSCLSAAFRIPIRNVNFLVPLLALAVFCFFFFSQPLRELRRLLLTCVVFTSVIFLVLILGTNYLSRQFVTYVNDAFSYCAFAQYLRDYPRGTQERLSPTDQYASTFSHSRYGTGATLAAVSAFTGLNIVRSQLPFWALLQLNAAFGLLALARRLRLRRRLGIYYALFYLLSGWALYALKIANLDNLLFLSLLPSFLAYASLLSSSSSVPGYISLAIISACLFYVYPEGILISIAGYSPLLFHPAIRQLRRVAALPRVIAVCLLCLLVAPFVDDFYHYLITQVQSMGATPRPGEGDFPMLLKFDIFWPISFFGLSRVFQAESTPSAISLVLTVLLLVFAIVGTLVTTSTKRLRAVALSNTIFGGLFLWCVAFERYDYAAYKILFLGFFALAALVFHGVQRATNAIPIVTRHPNFFFGSTLVLFLLNLAIESRRNPWFDADVSLREFERLEHCRPLVRDQACIAVMTKELRDMRLEWAMLFLRGINLQIPLLSPIMQGRVSEMRQHGSDLPRFVISDTQFETPIWHDRTFFLTPLPNHPQLLSIEAPNGVQPDGSQEFVWLDNRPAGLLVWSNADLSSQLVVRRVVTGPGFDPAVDKQAILKLNDDVKAFPANSQIHWPLYLRSGINQVSISSLNKWNHLPAPNGDPRIMLVGLLDCEVSSNSEPTNQAGGVLHN